MNLKLLKQIANQLPDETEVELSITLKGNVVNKFTAKLDTLILNPNSIELEGAPIFVDKEIEAIKI